MVPRSAYIHKEDNKFKNNYEYFTKLSNEKKLLSIL